MAADADEVDHRRAAVAATTTLAAGDQRDKLALAGETGRRIDLGVTPARGRTRSPASAAL